MARKKKTIPKVNTRKNEERFFTSNPSEMLGKYTASDILKTWTEDFVDEDTAEVVSIDRHEVLIKRGELIEGDLFAKIQFYLQSEEITRVEVSNQCRAAYCIDGHGSFSPWSIMAQIGNKKRRFLLYATCLGNAMEIAKDYIELNFSERFWFLNVKAFDCCIFIKNNLKKENEENEVEPTELNFYKIEVEVISKDISSNHTFVLQTQDIDSGMIFINDWISKKLQSDNETDEIIPFKTTIKSGVVIPCYRIIEKEFSEVYREEL